MAIAVSAEQACRLRCLGPVALHDASGAARPLRTRKQVALLVYLARRIGRPHSRDELIELLWSSNPEKAAKHSLSQTVSLINKALNGEAVVTSGRDRLALREGTVTLDVNDFERLATAGEHDEAMKLWRGTLLEGIYVQRAPNFERWLSEERARVQRAFRRMMHLRLESTRVAGDFAAMRDESDNLLQHDPLDEKAMLVHLESLSLLDERTLALRKYVEFEGRLRDELSAEPHAALQAWARRNRQARTARDTCQPQTPRISELTVLPVPVPLFGRDRESRVLWTTWESAQRGRGSFVVVEGEAGIGKSALVAKLVSQAHVAGGSVGHVRCFRSERSIPFATVSDLVRQLCRLPGFIGTDPIWIGELTRVVPELRERYPQAPSPMVADDAARHRISDATVQAALAVADEQPLLVALDDLQDADEASLALLHYLARQVAGWPMLLVGTRRTGEPGTQCVTQFFETASRIGFGTFVTLGPLRGPETGELIQRVLARRGIEASASQVSLLARQSEGNPLRAIEAALATADPAELAVPEKHATTSSESRTFEGSATARLASLPKEAQQVALTVAVAGRPLSEFELAEATSLGAATLASALMLLEEQHLLSRNGGEVSFVHDAYCVMAELSATKDSKKEIHRRLARLFMRSDRLSPATQCDVARHLSAAGESAEATRHALSAAQYAESVGAVRSAADALELAIENGESLAPEVVTSLCSCYLQLCENQKLKSLCDRYLSFSESGEALRSNLRYYLIAAEFETAGANLLHVQRDLEQLVSGAGIFERWADAHTLLIRVADKTGHYAIVHHATRSLRAAALQRRTVMPQALFATGYVIAKFYRPARAVETLKRAVETAEAEKQWGIALLARDCVAISLKQIGRYRESISQFNHSLALARKTMNHAAEMRCLINRGVSEIALGEYEIASDTIRAAQHFAGDVLTRGYCAFNVGIIALLSGSPEKALEHFQRCYEEADRFGAKSMASDARAAAAIACQRLNDLGRLARFTAELHATSWASQHLRLGWALATAQAWNKALVLGDFDDAIMDLERQAHAMRSRDVALWLAMQMEAILIREAKTGKREHQARQLLFDAAGKYEARGVQRTAVA